MNKREWKAYYRMLRVSRREALKASIDMMLYGNGFVFVPDDGSDARHIPVNDVVLTGNSDGDILEYRINGK